MTKKKKPAPKKKTPARRRAKQAPLPVDVAEPVPADGWSVPPIRPDGVDMRPIVSDVVADLLAASRQAHQAYRDAVPHRLPNGTASEGDPAAARAALERAHQTRVQAHNLDPNHTDPAWKSDDQHDELLKFYVEQLAK